MTLKIRSGSPKSNQLLVMSQLYVHEKFVRIQPLVHKVLCRQGNVTPMMMPLRGGGGILLSPSTPQVICLGYIVQSVATDCRFRGPKFESHFSHTTFTEIMIKISLFSVIFPFHSFKKDICQLHAQVELN